MPYDDDPRLDEQARHELAAELRRHGGVVGGLFAGQSLALAAEVSRHLDRIHEIMEALVARITASASSGRSYRAAANSTCNRAGLRVTGVGQLD